MEVTVGSKYQITIPVKLRKKFHLKPGMKLVFDENAPDLRAKPKDDFDIKAMRRALGAGRNIEAGKTSDEILHELRGYKRRELVETELI